MAADRDTLPAASAAGATTHQMAAARSSAGNRRPSTRGRRTGRESEVVVVIVISARELGEVGLHGGGDIGRRLLRLGAVAAGGGLAQGGEVVLETDVEVLVVGPHRALDGRPGGLDAVIELLGRLGVGGGGQADLRRERVDLPEPGGDLEGGGAV